MNLHSLIAAYCKTSEKISHILSEMITFSDVQRNQNLKDVTKFMAVKGNFGIGAVNLWQNADAQPIQPFQDEKNELAVVFDGELYNKDFFEEYLPDFSIETGSDVELVTYLFRKLISSFDLVSAIRKMIFMLEGIYVFIILWRNRLIIMRDPIGVKPLYFVTTPKCTLFSSQRKPLIFQTSEDIFYEDIQRIHQDRIYIISESGDMTKFTGEGLQKRRMLDSSPNKIIQSLIGYFRFAIERRLANHEKKFGILYSGGLDSSILARYLYEYERDLYLYTSGFQNTPDLENAKDSFSIFDATLKINELSLEDVEAEIPKILFYIEQPEIMQLNIAIPVHFSTLLAKRDDIHLLFSGQGLDELFCGYARHVKSVKSNGYDTLYEQLWHEFETFPQITLERDDALSKAHRKTYCLPFLDQRVVEYTMVIPPAFKVYNTGTKFVRKWILRQVAEKLHLPKKIVKRKKVAMQFGSGTASALSKIAKQHGFNKSLAKKCGYFSNQKMYLDAIACLLGFPFRERKRNSLIEHVPEYWKEKMRPHLSFMR